MPTEKEPQPENREKEPIDFARIFRDKLASIEPNKSGKLENIMVQDLLNGVKIKKEAVVLVFISEDQLDKYELWLDDWQDIENQTDPHYEAKNNLKNFCRQEAGKSKEEVKFEGFLIENQEGVAWLLVSNNQAECIEKGINGYNEQYIDEWLNLCSRYNIKKIIGNFSVQKRDGWIVRHTIGKTREIFSQDIVGQIREEQHLLDFIEKHRNILNNPAKVSRFELLVKTAREAAKKQGKPYSLQSILEDMET